MTLAIVIPCYNRPENLKHLLRSIERAEIPSHLRVPLVFSIDKSGEPFVSEIVRNFVWPYGPKEAIEHKKHIGLRENILFCGDLSQEYGSVAILEDDLFVSPAFYRYAVDAVDFYAKDERVAGISLYSYEYSGVARERFYPLYDGTDIYFMQVPSSWGQVWTKSQWNAFKTWYDSRKDVCLDQYRIPDSVKTWPESSWKKYFFAYLTNMKKYFVFPRNSFTTNLGGDGTHTHAGTTPIVQVALAYSAPAKWHFVPLEHSDIRYDSYFQPESWLLNKLCPWLAEYDYEVDLQATKPLASIESSYLLSIRSCETPIRSFGWSLFPLELNLAYGLLGDKIFFGPTTNFKERIDIARKAVILTWTRRMLSPNDYALIVLGKTIRKYLNMLRKY